MPKRRRFPWATMWAMAAPLSVLYLATLLLPRLPDVALLLLFLALAVGAGALAVTLEPGRSALAALLAGITSALLAYGGLFVIALIVEGGPFQVNARGQKIRVVRHVVETWSLGAIVNTILIGIGIFAVSCVFGSLAAASASLIRSRRRRRPRMTPPVTGDTISAKWAAIATILGALVTAAASIVSTVMLK